MKFELSPDNEKFLENAIANGDYQDRAEALNEAVRLMRARAEKLEKLRAAIEEGVEGPGIPASEVFPELLRRADEIARRAADR